MSGIDRLRTLAGEWDAYGLGGTLEDIAGQIERERACDADTTENVRLVVGVVVDEMEHHILGHEGMEDSPVARWARELRRALKSDTSDERDAQNPSWRDASETASVSSKAAKVTRDAGDVSMSAYDLLPADEREAIAWVREHGGLGHVKDICHDFRAVVERLGIEWSESELHGLMDVLDKRLMPEGMEWLLDVWPKWDNGDYCKFGDWWTAESYGEFDPKQLRKLSIYTPEQLDEFGQGNGKDYGYEWDFFRPSYVTYHPVKVEPPAPKVLDADGAEIRVGDTVWHTRTRDEYSVIGVPSKSVINVSKQLDGREIHGVVSPYSLTHRAPVIAADGRPLREGEHVWHIETGAELVVKELPKPGEYQAVVVLAPPASHLTSFDPDRLTHERPDSYDTLWDDIENCAVGYEGFMRRVKALAERGQ